MSPDESRELLRAAERALSCIQLCLMAGVSHPVANAEWVGVRDALRAAIARAKGARP